MSIVAMGCDMGTRTFTVTVLKYDRSVKVLDSFGFPNTIDNLTKEQLYAKYSKFVSSFIRLIKKYRPSIIYAERFMVRGRFMGASAELISYMLGVMHRICTKYKILFVPITASQWKNSFNKRVKCPRGIIQKNSLKDWYSWSKPTKPHYLDSCFIGIYGIEREYDKNLYPKINKTLVNSICKLERAENVRNKKSKAK